MKKFEPTSNHYLLSKFASIMALLLDIGSSYFKSDIQICNKKNSIKYLKVDLFSTLLSRLRALEKNK